MLGAQRMLLRPALSSSFPQPEKKNLVGESIWRQNGDRKVQTTMRVSATLKLLLSLLLAIISVSHLHAWLFGPYGKCDTEIIAEFITRQQQFRPGHPTFRI